MESFRNDSESNYNGLGRVLELQLYQEPLLFHQIIIKKILLLVVAFVIDFTNAALPIYTTFGIRELSKEHLSIVI